MSTKQIDFKTLVDYGTKLLQSKGTDEADARYIAETCVTTEAFGITTHGLAFLTSLPSQIERGLNAAAQPELLRETPAGALIDGKSGYAQLAMRMAKQLAKSKAREVGIAMVAVRNCAWLGAIGPQVISLAEDGLLVQAWAQSSQCMDSAPFGGIDAKFSTNPVALAFPTGGGVVVADFSTSSASMGKTGRMRRLGRKAPEKIFMDAEGQYSDDPQVVADGGTILFTGGVNFGYKGYAFSLWAEALTAMAGGSANNPDLPQKQSFNLMVIDPDLFAGNEYYLTEMKRFAAHVRQSRPRDPQSPVRLPGERGVKALADARENGVPVEQGVIDALNEIGESSKLDIRL